MYTKYISTEMYSNFPMNGIIIFNLNYLSVNIGVSIHAQNRHIIPMDASMLCPKDINNPENVPNKLTPNK